jgi:hypothetical protein
MPLETASAVAYYLMGDPWISGWSIVGLTARYQRHWRQPRYNNGGGGDAAV